MDTTASHVSHSEPPPPPIDHHDHHYDHHHHHDPYPDSPPGYPPPSYDDATGSITAPLLVGPPPDYGAIRAYPEPDESSVASSEIEGTDRSLPGWVGQGLVIVAFVFIIYGFIQVINSPDGMDDLPG